MLGIFKKPYPVRIYAAQVIVKGYASASYKDSSLRLNVQPLTPDELLALPEGDRTKKRVKSYGPDKLTSADAFEGIPGVRLYYVGRWYECISSVMWDHIGILNHYRSDFVMLPEEQQGQKPSPEGGTGP